MTMPAPLLIDLSHTSHTRARTGVQRVVRSLHAALGEAGLAITRDPYAGTWRPLQPWEKKTLTAIAPARKRGAQWPLAARIRSRLRKLIGRPRAAAMPDNAGLIVPEIFSPVVARALPELFAATKGARVAIFHDAIALKLPELTPTTTVARFPAYLQELLAFDGVAAISEESRVSLIEYWDWLGARDRPIVQTIGWGVDIERNPHPVAARRDAAAPVVLSVGSIEGRKNHVALLDACEQLWARGVAFTLHLVGLAQMQTGGAALARIRALQAAGRPVRYSGPISDAELNAAYAACAFSVYPSLMEGFGLPVLESLAHGRPCLCSGRGALGESTRDGGCVALDPVDADTIAAAIEKLLRTPVELASLQAAATRRTFKTWPQYVDELRGWMFTLRRRS